MKILLVNKYHYVKGGSEAYYFGLAKVLEEKGHQVIYFAMADERNMPCKQEDYFVKNVDFNGKSSFLKKFIAGFRVIYSFDAKRKMRKLIEKEQPDIVHINLIHRHITLSVVRAIKKFKIPIVMTLHDLNCICPNHTMLSQGKVCEDCLGGNYLPCVKKKCMKKSFLKSFLALIEAVNYKRMGIYNDIDLYISPSKFYKDKHIEARFTKNPIIHIKNFLPLDTKFNCNSDYKNYFLYFGRLSQEKGIMTLVKAFENLDSDTPLYILGTGEIEGEIKEYVREHNLEQKIQLKGFKSGDELKKYVADAKCIVLPSEWYENGPYAIMEAMSQGKPVVVSNYGGLPEIVQQGKTGYIFKAFDAQDLAKKLKKVEKLTREEYEAISKNAVEKAKEDFDYEKYYTQLMSHYERLVK